MRRALLLLIWTLTATLAKAQDLACKGAQDPLRVVKQTEIDSCRVGRAVCLEKFKASPGLLDYVKNCNEPEPVQEPPSESHLWRCLKTFPEPMMDMAKNLYAFLARRAKDSVEATRQQIAFCQKSEGFRRVMADQVPIIKSLQKKSVSFESCAAMVTEYQNWALQQRNLKALDKIGDLSFQKLLEEKNRNNLSPEAQNIFVKIWDRQKEKFSCLSSAGQAYLSCYYLFSVVDPALMVGLALKAPALLKGFDLAASGAKAQGAIEKIQGILKFEDLMDKTRLVDLSSLEAKIGKKLNVRYSDMSSGKIIFIRDEAGESIGFMSVAYNPENKKMTVSFVNTEENYRNKGVSNVLRDQAMIFYPDTQIVEATDLIETNRYVVDQGRRKGKSLEEAIKATPTYSSNARLGFTEIIPGSINPYTYGFQVRRPNAP